MATIFNSSIFNSAILDSDILPKTLTQTSSIWLKLIYSDWTWWYQPSWILPCWIQTLPSWIQTPCYLLSDSLKNTLHSILTLTQTSSIWLTLWWQPSWILPSLILPSWIQPFCTTLWLKLVQSDSNSFILTELDRYQPSWILPCWIQTLPVLDWDTLLSSLRFTHKHSSLHSDSESN